MPDQLERELERQRRRLLRMENHVAAGQVEAYAGVLRRFRQQLARLTAMIHAAQADGVDVQPGWVFQQDRTRRLLAQYEADVLRFAGRSVTAVQGAHEGAVELAVEHAPAAARAALGPGPADARRHVQDMFDRLPAAPLQRMVGRTASGQPLAVLLADLAPEGVQRLRDALAFGVAAGRGPRAIASDLRREASVPLARALNITRTETLRVYREASRDRFERSGLVEKWRWLATQSERTCPVCFAMHGTLHPVSESLNSHPSCRCTMVPVTPSWSELGFQGVPDRRPTVTPGRVLFDQLPESERLAILGRAKLDAYNAGRITLQDLVRSTPGGPWGPGLREANLAELGLPARA